MNVTGQFWEVILFQVHKQYKQWVLTNQKGSRIPMEVEIEKEVLVM